MLGRETHTTIRVSTLITTALATYFIAPLSISFASWPTFSMLLPTVCILRAFDVVGAFVGAAVVALSVLLL